MHQMSTGASNDFERATKLARAMVTRYGMSESLGTMVYEDTEQDAYFGRMSAKTVSEATQQKVDTEIRSILDAQYALSRRLLEENKDKVEIMANTLLEWETIDADQINDIMEGREPRLPKAGVPPRRASDGTSGGVSPNATAPA
jgi:cell division protease FtsH